MNTYTTLVVITFTALAGSGLLFSPTYAAEGTMDATTAKPRHAEMAPAKGKQSGMHSITGKVEDLDTETGMVELKTAEGPLKLHFPPKSLAQIKKGDELQIHLGFTPTGK